MRKTAYNPVNKTVTVGKGSSLYDSFHELAHKQQHMGRPLWFGVLYFLTHVRFIGYFATLRLEWDAKKRARKNMIALELWDKTSDMEARAKFRSYLYRS